MPGPQASSPASTLPPKGPQIRSRKPTGLVPFPLILLTGEEKAGKSLVPVVMSRSPRVGMTYWVDLGEGTADEYGRLPGAEYEVIEHNGTYREILAQVTAVWHEAARARAAAEPPVVLVVDSMSALWTMLVNWTNDRARRSNAGQRKLARDPDAEIDPTSNLWNDANDRNGQVMNLLMTFPGIAVVTAHGKEVTVMDADGQPTKETTRKPEGQKRLASQCDAWVWMTREPRSAELVGVRSIQELVAAEVKINEPLPTVKVGPWEVLDLETWIFDVLGAGYTAKDDLPALRGDEVQGVLERVAATVTEDDLKALWFEVKAKVTPAQAEEVLAAVNARLVALREEPTTEEPGEANLADHGPASDAERLRQAADARRLMDQSEDRPTQDGVHQ